MTNVLHSCHKDKITLFRGLVNSSDIKSDLLSQLTLIIPCNELSLWFVMIHNNPHI